MLGPVAGRTGADDDLAALKTRFIRPSYVPIPRDNPLSAARIALGERLFSERRLSRDDSVSCATCHDPALSYGDGVPLGRGVTRERLMRHTPSLWNVAWARALFWDGRAGTLEEQARIPIEHPKEMGQPLELGVAKLAMDPGYVRAFAQAFPDDPRITAETVVKALASFERTLVSPPTRFDRWIGGDDTALSEEEVAGFRLFTGKAGCVNCHSGWAFTDYAFHDIGLPGSDLGRGPVIGLSAVDHAFKTPSLRELVWTAPYMHDGSLATLDDVLDHYQRGGIARATRSPDLPPYLDLNETERAQLVAFLETLSSERPPRPLPVTGAPQAARQQAEPPAIDTLIVSQREKQFTPTHVLIEHGRPLTIINDDRRPHNVRIFDPRLEFNSGLQEPGDKAEVRFPVAGSFDVFCGIHPNMRLTVDVK